MIDPLIIAAGLMGLLALAALAAVVRGLVWTQHFSSVVTLWGLFQIIPAIYATAYFIDRAAA